MCTNCAHSTFGYHITGKNNLASIRKGGMSPLKTRTGSWTAAETGSFAADRKEKLPGKKSSRVTDLVLRSLRAGLSESQIVGNPFPTMMVPIDVPVTGSTEDNVQLNDELDQAIAQYVSEIAGPPTPTPKPVKTFGHKPEPRVSVTVAKKVADLIRSTPEHYLVRTAETYEEWASTIEEKITGQHVYFFVKNHNAVLAKYAKLNGGLGGCILLRVRLAKLHGHEPDGSDADAVMTTATVLPEALEQCLPGDELMKSMPPEDRRGDNVKLWEQRGSWASL